MITKTKIIGASNKFLLQCDINSFLKDKEKSPGFKVVHIHHTHAENFWYTLWSACITYKTLE